MRRVISKWPRGLGTRGVAGGDAPAPVERSRNFIVASGRTLGRVVGGDKVSGRTAETIFRMPVLLANNWFSGRPAAEPDECDGELLLVQTY